MRSASSAIAVALVYFGAGALVKLVVDEEGSGLAARLWDRVELTEQVQPSAGQLARTGRFVAVTRSIWPAPRRGDPELIMAVWDPRRSAGARASGITVSPTLT